MRVIYDGVDMFAIETHEFIAEPVYDDSMTDYLYTRYSIHVTAVVNGQVRVDPGNLFMSYNFNGGVAGSSPPNTRSPSPFVGNMTPGSPPFGTTDPIGISEGPAAIDPRSIVITPVPVPLTHQAIRHRLTVPRAPLYIFTGGGMETGTPPAGGFGAPNPAVSTLFLTSPVAPFSVDAKNGPIPRVLNLTAAFGDAQTCLVEFAVETYVNEANENNARPFSSILSNRWRQRHTVDEDGYTTISTQGVSIFRTDFVYNEENSPDISRQIVFMPIPQGFVRTVDYVDTREDVTGIEYAYTDKQVPVNFVAGPFVGAAQITAVHRQSVTSNVDFLPTAIALAERGMGMVLNAKWLRARESTPPSAGGGVKHMGPSMMAALAKSAKKP